MTEKIIQKKRPGRKKKKRGRRSTKTLSHMKSETECPQYENEVYQTLEELNVQRGMISDNLNKIQNTYYNNQMQEDQEPEYNRFLYDNADKMNVLEPGTSRKRRRSKESKEEISIDNTDTSISKKELLILDKKKNITENYMDSKQNQTFLMKSYSADSDLSIPNSKIYTKGNYVKEQMQCKRSPQNLRDQTMKDYVVTRSISSKRDLIQTRKDSLDTIGTTEAEKDEAFRKKRKDKTDGKSVESDGEEVRRSKLAEEVEGIEMEKRKRTGIGGGGGIETQSHEKEYMQGIKEELQREDNTVQKEHKEEEEEEEEYNPERDEELMEDSNGREPRRNSKRKDEVDQEIEEGHERVQEVDEEEQEQEGEEEEEGGSNVNNLKGGKTLRNSLKTNTYGNSYNMEDIKTNSYNKNLKGMNSEVSASNIINCRRKRKNVEDAIVENSDNKMKNEVKASNKPKKGKKPYNKNNANMNNDFIKNSSRNNNINGKPNSDDLYNNNNHDEIAHSSNDQDDDEQAENDPQNDKEDQEHTNSHHTSNPNNITTNVHNNVNSTCNTYNNVNGSANCVLGNRHNEKPNGANEELESKKRKKRVTEEGSKESSKINVGENFQVQKLPTFFLCRSELVHKNYESSEPEDNTDKLCLSCLGLPCHCKSNGATLVYSPLILEQVRERCLKSRGYRKCIKNEGDLSAFVQNCAKNWNQYIQTIPFSPEYAYKLLHYANYDPVKAIALMSSNDCNLKEILDPPTRKYQNKWKPKDKREHLPKDPFPSPLTIRTYLSKRQQNSGYHLR